MMRRQALRASSTHNVCVFCATRLNHGSLLDAALHPLPSSSSARSSNTSNTATATPAATRYLLQQRRGISTSRPSSQNLSGGGGTAAATAPQSQRSREEAERDALRNRFPREIPPAAQQPPAAAAATDPARRSLFRKTPSESPRDAQSSWPQKAPEQQHRITYTNHRRSDGQAQGNRWTMGGSRGGAGPAPGGGNGNGTGYQVRVEQAEQVRSQQKWDDVVGFDVAKANHWQILRPRNGQTQQQPGQTTRMAGGRQEGRGKAFVPLSSEQKREKEEELRSRFATLLGGRSGGTAAQEQPRPHMLLRPNVGGLRSVRPAEDAARDALKSNFGDPAQEQAQPQTSPSADPEREALKSIFGGLAQQKAQPQSSPFAHVERDESNSAQDSLRDFSPKAKTRPGPEQAQETKEFKPERSDELDAALTQVRERERASRFSKFADVEEEAPRKRKARGGWSKTSTYEEEEVDIGRVERKSKKDRKKKRAVEVAPPTPIYLPEYLSVVSLANMLRVRTDDLVHKMEELGYEDINNDDILNAENAGLIAMEYNFEPAAADPSDDLDLYPAPEPEDKTAFPTRPPVVTIMGHVDHGKTTILDYLRKSSVAATEFGGITQHIGAFSVPLSGDKTITFLDTPGHAAFLSMRQRGANVTDIVILVVAADDSVKPQTLEAVKHAKAARVPMIVAINKIDKEGANIERVKQDLARHGVDVEDFGGDVQAIPVSGKTGQGMQDLEEAAVTLSEILDHRADPNGPVEGWILEASTKKSGKTATVLVRRGTLRVGSIIVAGKTFARVRSIKNEAGVAISSVAPGMPAEIDGWRGTPEAGDKVLEAPDEQRANEVVEYREANAERVQMAKDMEAINEARRLEHERRQREEAAAAEATETDPEGAAATAAAEAAEEAELAASGPEEVPFVVKADVSGSVEAVVDYVMTVGNGEVRARVLRTGVGAVSESDVELAGTAGGHVVAFNTVLEPRVARIAELRGVRVFEQNIIYRLVEDVKALLSERLAPAVTRRVTGEATILEVFQINLGRKKFITTAGCRVTNGVVNRNSKVRVLRGEKSIYEGSISSLKEVRKDVMEMRKGNECGMAFGGWGNCKAGDTIQCFEEIFTERSL